MWSHIPGTMLRRFVPLSFRKIGQHILLDTWALATMAGLDKNGKENENNPDAITREIARLTGFKIVVRDDV